MHVPLHASLHQLAPHRVRAEWLPVRAPLQAQLSEESQVLLPEQIVLELRPGHVVLVRLSIVDEMIGRYLLNSVVPA